MPIESGGGYRMRDNYARQFGGGGSGVKVGKPDTAFTQGVLTDPNNVVSLWKGPAHTGDADTTRNLTVHYAVMDCATTDYVVCELIGGKWYVAKLVC